MVENVEFLVRTFNSVDGSKGKSGNISQEKVDFKVRFVSYNFIPGFKSLLSDVKDHIQCIVVAYLITRQNVLCNDFIKVG